MLLFVVESEITPVSALFLYVGWCGRNTAFIWSAKNFLSVFVSLYIRSLEGRRIMSAGLPLQTFFRKQKKGGAVDRGLCGCTVPMRHRKKDVWFLYPYPT